MGEPERRRKAQERAALIVRVQAGQISAVEAARQLGVSRKTYYKWEARALAALVGSLEDREGGRPESPQDEEKDRLREEVGELRGELDVHAQRERVREMMGRVAEGDGEKKGGGATGGDR